MRFNKWIFGTMLAASFLAVQSCKKIENFGADNSNPNATTSPNTAALLTNVLAGQGVNVWGGYPGSLTVTAGLFCQYFTETQYTEGSRYQTPSIDWDGAYAGRLYDLQNIINYNTSNPADAAANGDNVNQIAIARILKAYNYWMLTDSYGDLPYFNALKGNGNLAYDAQSAIYPDLIKELKEAVDQFNLTPSTSIKGDILFGGNISLWRKFANSVRLLIALQMSRKDPATAQAKFIEALNHPAGVMTTTSDNASLAYPGSVFYNPVYNFYVIGGRVDVALCKTVTDVLVSYSDNRKTAFGTSTVGFPYGLNRTDASVFYNNNPNWAMIKASAGSPLVLVGAANVYLARAEAANLGWATGDNAAAMYSLGIQRSWEQWGVYDATQFANYIASSSVDLSTGSAASKIGLQTWLAWYPNGWRGWSTWRKTGYPALSLPPQNPATPNIPRRIPYGPREAQVNIANYTPAAANYTIAGVPNSQDAKIWWDQ